MISHLHLAAFLFVALGSSLLTQISSAQSPRLIQQFSLPGIGGEDGSNAASRVIQAADGSFYGTTVQGGAWNAGTIYQVRNGILATVYDFTDSVSSGTHTALVLGQDGIIYGTTAEGGTFSEGTAFKLTPSGQFTLLHNFGDPSQLTEGFVPQGLIQGSDGNFYGYTLRAPNGYGGTLFKMTPDGTVSTLHTFGLDSLPNDASGPVCLIQAMDGNFYGVTSNGGTGANDSGTIFKMTPAGDVTILHNFNDGSVPKDGITPMDFLQGSDGNFYGTTFYGGSTNPNGAAVTGSGTVYKMTPDGTCTILHNFNDGTVSLDGTNPVQLIRLANGSFVGSTQYGGNNFGNGTVFKMNAKGVETVISNFFVGLTPADDGYYYGATGSAFYKIWPTGKTTLIYSFGAGILDVNGLALGQDGNLYGTSYLGGNHLDCGTLFRVTPTGAISVLYSFLSYEGEAPLSPPCAAKDGYLYVTTSMGGMRGQGAIARLTTDGKETTLHSFGAIGDGASPFAPLIEGSDGYFYGTTQNGGSTGCGTVFRMNHAGGVSILHNFGDGKVANEGKFPITAVVQGKDGNLYGTTQNGGIYGAGSVYQVTPKGVTTLFTSFGNPAVANAAKNPATSLVQAPNGSFYGVTPNGGSAANGTIYRVSPTGVLTTVHSFGDGSIANDGFLFPSMQPVATALSPLLVGKDGYLYGITSGGGPLGMGTLFLVNHSDQVSILEGFGGIAQRLPLGMPNGPLVQDSQGAFYGTTSNAPFSQVFLAAPLAKITQSITFPPPVNPVVGSFVTLNASASSNLPVTYAVAGPATLSGNILTLTGSTDVRVTASQPGDDLFKAAVPVRINFVAAKAPQTISFPAMENLPANRKYALSATSSAGLPITYLLVSGPATLSGRILTFTGTGTVTITARQLGNSLFAPATDVTSALTVVNAP